jgi:hypothetical protein
MPMANAHVKGRLVSVGLAGALCALAVQAAEDSHVVPGSRAAKLEHCVEPTPFMRRNHMELILHQRDVTVHTGIHSSKYSIEICVDCHVSYAPDGKPIPINQEGQFCDNCHEYAAVKLDCFQCHATVPEKEPAGADARKSTQRPLAASSLGAFAFSGSILHPEHGGEGN